MIGFSAGAFLAVDVALDPGGEPPLAFIGAIYGGETRRRAGAGRRAAAVLRRRPGRHPASRSSRASTWTGPTADRSAELHVFGRGAHGFGMVRQGTPSDRWTDLFLAWLADRDMR